MTDRTTNMPEAPWNARPGRPLRGAVLVLAGLLLAATAWGQDEQESGYVSPYDPVSEYLDAIDRMETDYGPYATELSDLFLGLGQTLINRGEYEKARDAFHRGVLVVRVNSGPNSPEQTNHLYLLANIESTLGNKDTADKILHNIQFINSEFYGKDSPKMLPVLDRMYQWYVVTRLLGNPNAQYSDYYETVEISEEMVRIAEESLGNNHPDTAAAVRRLADAQFQTTRYLLNELESYRAIEAPINDFFAAGQYNYRKYLQILQLIESTTPQQYAEAMAELGDWYLLFNKPALSRTLYQQGYLILTETEQTAEVIDNYMAQPRPLNYVSNAPLVLPEEEEKELQELNLEVSMTVTTYGEIREAEVVKAPRELSEKEIELIRQQLRNYRFRPAMKEGEIITTRDFIWQYSIAMGGAS